MTLQGVITLVERGREFQDVMFCDVAAGALWEVSVTPTQEGRLEKYCLSPLFRLTWHILHDIIAWQLLLPWPSRVLLHHCCVQVPHNTAQMALCHWTKVTFSGICIWLECYFFEWLFTFESLYCTQISALSVSCIEKTWLLLLCWKAFKISKFCSRLFRG